MFSASAPERGKKGEKMRSVLSWCLVSLLATSLVAQTAPKKKKAPAKPAQPAVTAADVQALRDALAAQQQQLETLKQQLDQTNLSLIHISEPTRLLSISYAVFCLK